MRKFFIVTMIAFVAFSLVAMTGCSNNTKITVTQITNTPNYAYKVSHASPSLLLLKNDYYIIEFWGGTAEQRQTVATTPYYKKYAVRFDFMVSTAINDNIEAWGRMMKQQKP